MSVETTRVIRPAAVLREIEARQVLAALSEQDVSKGGVWNASPGLWQRYDGPWDGPAGVAGNAQLIGTIASIYGSPTRYDITIYRATVSAYAVAEGWTVETLCDDALAHAGLSLEDCPRADLQAPPAADPFKE